MGGLLASLTAIAAEYSPEKYRSLAVVCITAGYPMDATSGGFIAAVLISDYSWQSVFFVGASLTLVMVALLIFKLPESLQFLLIKQPANALIRINTLILSLKGSSELDFKDAILCSKGGFSYEKNNKY